MHFDNLKGGKQLNKYDPFSRNPLFCGAENTSLWELKKLSVHFHPSVALLQRPSFRETIFSIRGPPAGFHSNEILDRFVYRNPKPHKGKENTDSVVMQPKRKHFIKDIRHLPVNSKEFLAKKKAKYQWMKCFSTGIIKVAVKEKQKRDTDEESIEDVDDEEFEN